MITYVEGDPLLTRAQFVAFGTNAKGRAEASPLVSAIADRWPAAFATFGKQCRGGRIKPGGLWTWRESRPYLLFTVVRESPVGMTRIRFVENAVLTLARDYRLYGVQSIALAPLGTDQEWAVLREVVERWLARSPLPVTVYERYLPGVDAEAELNAPPSP